MVKPLAWCAPTEPDAIRLVSLWRRGSQPVIAQPHSIGLAPEPPPPRSC